MGAIPNHSRQGAVILSRNTGIIFKQFVYFQRFLHFTISVGAVLILQLHSQITNVFTIHALHL